jgi:predicted lipoprotein with Yx(FWY)xxD motif
LNRDPAHGARSRLLRSAFFGAAAVAATFTLAACGNSNVSVLSSPPTTDTTLTLTVQHSPGGLILASGAGATLYDFAPDTPTHSACTNDGCVFGWPPLVKDGPITLGPGLKRSLVGTLRRPDGSTQISYGGHPLYTYNMDVTPGMVTGQGIDQDGGLWYVINPSGHQITTGFTVNG